jgi:hypothetical protein
MHKGPKELNKIFCFLFSLCPLCQLRVLCLPAYPVERDLRRGVVVKKIFELVKLMFMAGLVE